MTHSVAVSATKQTVPCPGSAITAVSAGAPPDRRCDSLGPPPADVGTPAWAEDLACAWE